MKKNSVPKTGRLVLTRQPGQTICVGDDIEILVVSISGNQVKLGVVAPGLPVDRKEIREKINEKEK